MNKNLATLLKYELKRFIKNPSQLFFAIIFPTSWMLISGKIWGGQYINGTSYMNVVFPSFIMMVILVLTINNIPLNIAHNIQTKTLKQFRVIKIRKNKYLLSLFIINLFLYTLMFLLLILLGSTIYDLNIIINTFYMFIGSILLFTIIFYFGILLASISRAFSTTLSICLIVFYVLLFTSGSAIPAHVAGNWFVYLQKISFAGNGVILLQQILQGRNISNDIFPMIYLLTSLIFIVPLSIKIFKYT